MGKFINLAGIDFAGGGSAPVPPVPPGPTPVVTAKDVNFRDYDGSIVASYTKAEFAALIALPAAPVHEGLTFQGWNYTLADAQAYVAAYGIMEIGATYISSDGATRVRLVLTEGYTSPTLILPLSGTCIIDWGDGSVQDTITGTGSEVSISHNYNDVGSYVVSITPSDDSLVRLIGDIDVGKINWILWDGDRNEYYNTFAIREVVIGHGVEIGSLAFNGCLNLSSVVIPDSVTSIGDYAFSGCLNLSSVVIPNSVTSIGDYAFSDCYRLSSVVIPDSVTSIGEGAFAGSGLSSVVIPDSVTSIGVNAFNGNSNLSSVVIPDSVTSIGDNTFFTCLNLSSVVIPNSVTSIGDYAFSDCYGLSSVVIPDSVTNIGDNAFSNAIFVTIYATTPPTMSNAFSLPSDGVIYVPAASVDAYKSASGWSDYASQIQPIP